MKNSDAKSLCELLINADDEQEVIEQLTEAGYWNDPAVWRDLGDEPENYSTVGNQQSRSEHALAEKLINAIDTKLMAASLLHGIDPEGPQAPLSMISARDAFFGQEMKDPEALSRDISVAATGRRAPGRPSISIADNGEGQTPFSMPRTILSVLKGSKKRIPFVQGKFHMGGTGVLEFCGASHNVQLVVTKRHPDLLPQPLADRSEGDWSFTIVRREDPAPGLKSSRFTFLAPGVRGPDGRRGVLHFDAPTLPIFPEKNRPYARQCEWGTLFKLYEYDVRAKTNMMLDDGLMARMRLLLPEPALPIRFHECRDFRGHSGSFDTTMIGVIGTLDADYRILKRDNVEWFDKSEMDVAGERFACRIYLFKSKAAADNYRKDEGVIFAYNGQSHAVFSKDFFRRSKVKQDYLWHSLLVFVDCSGISIRAHEKLFMANRTQLRDGELKRALEEELQDNLKRHQQLKAIASARRERERAAQPAVSETFKNFLEEMVKKYPLLASVLAPGLRIRNPHKPASVAQAEKPWKGKRFPTRFLFKGHDPGFELNRDANINSQVRISLETDAEDSYFSRDVEPGTFALHQITGNGRIPAKNWKSPNLFRGIANFSLAIPADAAVGSAITYEADIMDASRIEPFNIRFMLRIRPERSDRPRPPTEPPPPLKPPSSKPGPDRQDDTRLDIPEPTEVYQRDWPQHEPPFDRLTAMIIKEPPDSAGNDKGIAYDYYINMDNVFLQMAQKEEPKRAAAFKARFKHGMALITLALIQHDLVEKRGQNEDVDDGDEGNRAQVDVRDRVREVTNALAPFILPLIDGLSAITEDTEAEALTAVAGEA